MRLSNEVISVLDDAKCDGNKLFLAGSPVHKPETPLLERSLYTAVNKALMALGGKWDRAAQAHLFEENIEDAIADAVAAGEVEDRKKVLQFFETPRDVVYQMMELARLDVYQSILEPSAGRGAIAAPILNEYSGVTLTCIEIDKANADTMQGNEIKGKRFKKGSFRVINRDFLKCTPALMRDRVVMNPPFSGGRDQSHFFHALKFLHTGARIVSVMSAGLTFRQDKRSVAFRQFIDEQDGQIIPLPEGSFRESGTNVNTCLVTMVKH